MPQGERLDKPAECPDAVWNVINSCCFATNPNERTNFDELIKRLHQVDIYTHPHTPIHVHLDSEQDAETDPTVYVLPNPNYPQAYSSVDRM